MTPNTPHWSLWSPSCTILGMVTEEVPIILAPGICIHIWRTRSLRGGAENLGIHPRLNPHNSGTPWANPSKFKRLTKGRTAHKPWNSPAIAQGIHHYRAFRFKNCANF